MVIGTEKHCPRCDLLLPADAFNRNRARADGLAPYCRQCRAASERSANERYRASGRSTEAQRRYRASPNGVTKRRAYQRTPAQRARARDRRLRGKYGLSTAEIEAMLVAQGGRCAICRTDTPTKAGWSVDHCHACQGVRGMLCNRCNTGALWDAPGWLDAARDYLAAHQCG